MAQRPMQFDGAYAAAQLWKLDTSPLFKGCYVQLSAILAEYLMLPAFPSARFKAWAEQYNRLPTVSMAIRSNVPLDLLPGEELPGHMADDSTFRCCALHMVGGVWTWIEYQGTLAQYLSQREAIFGTTPPRNVQIADGMTVAEQVYLIDWEERYLTYWPLVNAARRPRRGLRPRAPPHSVHPRLATLYAQYRTFLPQWADSIEHEPFEGPHSYVAMRYYNGALVSRVVHNREQHGVFVNVADEMAQHGVEPPSESEDAEDDSTTVPDDDVLGEDDQYASEV
jgi:hypothetical protein